VLEEAATHTASPQLPSALSADDVAEYRRRLDAAREVMRRHGLDCVVVGSGPPQLPASAISVGGHGRIAQPRYHRWFSGFHIWGGEGFAPQPVVVVLPLEGQPSLVVRAGTGHSWATLARSQSWIENVVATYKADRDWEWESNWGLSSPELPSDVAAVLRSSGLDDARIGVAGSWPGMDETTAALPRASFEPTFSVKRGEPTDLLVHLLDRCSPWEIRKLERAQALADEAMRAVMETAQPGVLIDEAVAEARYRALRGGSEDMVLETTCGTDDWSVWVAPTQARNARYRDGDIVSVSIGPSYEGYWIQLPRTWKLGSPTPAERRVFDAARSSLDAVLARVEPGVTGRQLWEAGLAPIERAGLEPRGRLGHSVGYTVVSGPERFSILPDNDSSLEESVAFVVHPCVWDRSAGIVVQIGDALVLENGRARHLSQNPVGHHAFEL
jgi:Xaa-Pro aminopeptidase